jgi:hypothetical protein
MDGLTADVTLSIVAPSGTAGAMVNRTFTAPSKVLRHQETLDLNLQAVPLPLQVGAPGAEGVEELVFDR